MSFGAAFGKLVKRRRGVEGLTQQALAVAAFGDESYKARISELENGKVASPQQKTVDALVVALKITEEEIVAARGFNPHARYVDTLVDFFDVGVPGSVDIEVAVNDSGMGVVFHSKPLKVELKRVEFFAEEQTFVILTKCGKRRDTFLPLTKDVLKHIHKCSEILFVYRKAKPLRAINGTRVPYKYIE